MPLTEQSNPITNPKAYDVFLLDAKPHPGKSEIGGGGDGADKIEGMQSLGDDGATTVVRGTELGEVTYLVSVWTTKQLGALGAWLDMLRAGRKKRPRKTYTLQDPRIEHNGYERVITRRVGKIQKLAAGLWGVEVVFAEWKRRQSRGGPVRAPNAELEAARAAEQKASEQLDAAIKDAEAALSKAEKTQGG